MKSWPSSILRNHSSVSRRHHTSVFVELVLKLPGLDPKKKSFKERQILLENKFWKFFFVIGFSFVLMKFPDLYYFIIANLTFTPSEIVIGDS